jgi:hypothetical protein
LVFRRLLLSSVAIAAAVLEPDLFVAVGPVTGNTQTDSQSTGSAASLV